VPLGDDVSFSWAYPNVGYGYYCPVPAIPDRQPSNGNPRGVVDDPVGNHDIPIFSGEVGEEFHPVREVVTVIRIRVGTEAFCEAYADRKGDLGANAGAE
jgi:hypothetical protein